MTPQQIKAKELVDKMYQYNKSIHKAYAKQCAIIACREAINVCAFEDYKIKKNHENCNDYADYYFATWWEEIIEEINKL